MIRNLCRCLLLVVTFGTGMSANATLLDFKFQGTASAGSFMVLAGGPVNISNAPFTITGSTTSDSDLAPGPGVGIFQTTTVFDFGGLGSFVSDLTTTALYLQNCGAPGVAISCAGLNDLNGGQLTVFFTPILGNANLGGIPVGMDIVPTSTNFLNPFQLTNLNQDFLNLNFEAIRLFSITAVPAPGSLLLVMLGLAGLAGFTRSKS